AHARLPGRLGGRADRAGQPRDRVAFGGGGDGGRGMPEPAWGGGGRGAATVRPRSRRGSQGRAALDRGLRARGPGDPARGGPPRRRPDARSYPARSAQGGPPCSTRGWHLRAGARGRRGGGERGRPGRLRTAYLGTSEFAATVLRRLAESSHRPALVVT